MILILLAFATLCLMPGLTANSQITKLTICTGLLLLVPRAPGCRNLTVTRCLMLAWLAWAAVGCYLCDNPQLAIYGFHLRYEGLVTYGLAFIMAGMFWRRWDGSNVDRWGIVTFLGVITASLTWLDYRASPDIQAWILPNIAQAAMLAVAAVILYGIWRPLAILAAPPLIWTQNRSAIFALCVGIVVIEALRWRWTERAAMRLGIVAGVIGMVVLFSPIRTRLVASSVTLRGARTQWMMQADVAGRGHLPIFGFGLDTGSKWLNPPQAEYFEMENGVPVLCDKTHNIAFDMILMTGWTGYVLLLLAVGSGIGVAFKHPSAENVTCLAGLATFVSVGMMNPVGVPAIVLGIGCLWGIRK